MFFKFLLTHSCPHLEVLLPLEENKMEGEVSATALPQIVIVWITMITAYILTKAGREYADFLGRLLRLKHLLERISRVVDSISNAIPLRVHYFAFIPALIIGVGLVALSFWLTHRYITDGALEVQIHIATVVIATSIMAGIGHRSDHKIIEQGIDLKTLIVAFVMGGILLAGAAILVVKFLL